MRLMLLMLACATLDASPVDDRRLLKAIGHVESGMVRSAVGDRGDSLGCYQQSSAAWVDASRQLKKEGLPSYARSMWRSPAAQDAMALAYIRWIRNRLVANGYPRPTIEQIAVCWNYGTTSALRHGLPLTEYAKRVRNIYTTSR
jgi:hypothetical protein